MDICHLATRFPDKERRVHDLVVERHHGFAPPAVLAKKEAVVGVDDEHGVVPKLVLVHLVEHFAKVGVAHGDEGSIEAVHVSDRIIVLKHGVVGRPVGG